MDGIIFKEFIDAKRLNKTKLAEDLGMSKQNLYQLFETKEFQPETINKIEKKFRTRWQKIKEAVNIDVLRPLEEPQPTYLQSRQNLKNGTTKGIPVYEAAPVTLTNTPSFRDEKAEGPDFWITIPQLRDCNYGTRAKGDSMHPLIRTNALVIGREITDIKVIIFGEIYIIMTKGGIETVKYIHPHESEPDILLLVPYNDKAKITPVHKSDILKLYEAKAVFNTI